MKKNMKRLFGLFLVLAMCVALLPVQAAKAEGLVYSKPVEFVDEMDMSDEQLKEAYLGTWKVLFGGDTVILSEDGMVVLDSEGNEVVKSSWSYDASYLMERVPQTENQAMGLTFPEYDGEISDAVALVYEDGEYQYTIYKMYSMGMGGTVLLVEAYTLDTVEYVNGYTLCVKVVDENEYYVNDCLLMVSEDEAEEPEAEEPKAEEPKAEEPEAEEPKAEEPEADEPAVEEPKTEEPETEEPKAEEPEAEEPATEEQEVAKVLESGRKVYVGEEVYVVKAGDCLWAIAEKLLVDGRRYNELFTRNGDIIQKAEMIFPGQEVIVPAK